MKHGLTPGDHQPVLLNEAVAGLNIQQDGLYVDATFGRGGHSQQILSLLADQGQLIAIDKDPEAVVVGHQLAEKDSRFRIWHGSYCEIVNCLAELKVDRAVNGILLDLGLSSPQLDSPARGFSFMNDGPLDMRFDPGKGIPASAWLAQIDEEALAKILREYGDERFSGRIARVLIAQAKGQGIATTAQLASLIEEVVPRREKHKHPATRTFQAIRIALNQELEDLKRFLQVLLDVLEIGGRMVVISFQSIEDRLVKQFVRLNYRGPGEDFPRGLPVITQPFLPQVKPVGKIIRPGEEELGNNPRARSAVMRIAEKLR